MAFNKFGSIGVSGFTIIGKVGFLNSFRKNTSKLIALLNPSNFSATIISDTQINFSWANPI
jgi:hypothetical protein